MLQVILLLSAAALVGLDQWTKVLATQAFEGKPPCVLIPGVLELCYSENDGAAFGLFPNQQWILIGLTSLIMLAILAVLFSGRYRRYRLLNLGGVLIVAGGIGNLIDRLFRGYVVDFIYIRAIHFPIFNLADTLVVCGAVLFLFCFLFFDRETADKQIGLDNAAGEKEGYDGKTDTDSGSCSGGDPAG